MAPFTFVQYAGSGIPDDPATRLLIRKHVMKRACHSRKTKSIATHAKVDSTHERSSQSGKALQLVQRDTKTLPFLQQLLNTSSIIVNPATDYERLCIQHDLDLDQLSGLTCFGVCSPMVAALADDTKLISLLDNRQDTFLRFIPSRYGHVACITAATDCVMAKLADRLHHSDKALPLYIKALQEVQQCTANADAMCAIMLLSLYELLDANRAAFEKHIYGVARLTRFLQASAFTSDYEMMLLYSSLGRTVVESIMYWDHCYLEAPEWRQILLNFTQETQWLTNRSPLVVRVHLTEAHLPGFIWDTDLAVHSRDVGDLIERLYAEREELMECSALFKAHISRTALLKPPTEDLWLRREMLGTLLEHFIINGRCLAAIDDTARINLEATTQDMARQLEDLIAQPGTQHAWLFSYHERSVHMAAQQTHHLFQQDLQDQTLEMQWQLRVKRWKTFKQLLMTEGHPKRSIRPSYG